MNIYFKPHSANNLFLKISNRPNVSKNSGTIYPTTNYNPMNIYFKPQLACNSLFKKSAIVPISSKKHRDDLPDNKL
jgi:hypothetical protein